MKRRTFLWISGAGVVTAALPFGGCSTTSYNAPSWVSHPHDLSQLCDEATIRAIGQTWLTVVPEENDREKLSAALTPPENHQQAGWEQWIAKKIESDFKNGNTHVLQGWVVSDTEARQCALYSLQSK